MSDSNNAILKLQSLQNEYQNKLIDYETANATYISSLQSTNPNSLVTIPGKSYWGSVGITEGPANTSDECKAMCSSNKLCKGAIFNSEKLFCWVRGGESSLTIGTSGDNAIISQMQQNIYNLNSINQELIDINNKIIAIHDNNPSLKNSSTSLLDNSSNSLENNYMILNIEREKIAKLLEQYNDVNQEYQDKNISVDQSSFSFYLWMIIAIFAFLISIKMFAYPEIKFEWVKTGGLFVFLTLFIFATIQLKNPIMYAFWLLAILIFLVIKFNLF